MSTHLNCIELRINEYQQHMLLQRKSEKRKHKNTALASFVISYAGLSASRKHAY